MAHLHADVAVIGLGAMGALTAWRLAARGAKVIAFERFRPGHDRGSSHGESRIFRTAYFESPEYVPLLQRAHQLWRRLESETGSLLLTQTGGLMIGAADGELITGVLRSAFHNRLPHQVLSRSEMEHRHPQHRLGPSDVAVLEEKAGFIRPERSVEAAAARAESLGARLMVETEVTAVEAASDRVDLETSSGKFSADRAVVAAGAWTAQLLPEAGLPLEVERQVVAWLEIGDPAAFAPHRFPVFIHEIEGGRFRYGFPSTDGRTIKVAVHHEGAPASPDTLDRNVSELDTTPIREFASEWMNGVKPKIDRAGVCMYTNAPDERFIVTSPEHMPGVTVVSACSGHGFKFASAIGDLIADALLESRPVPPIIRTRLGATA
jgi:sarcosine oxidase